MEKKEIQMDSNFSQGEIKLGDFTLNTDQLIIFAGPCAIEGEEQIFTIAEAVRRAGGHILRGGAFKPRTSPYAFQGLGIPGLKLMREAADAYQLPIVSEVMDTRDVEVVSQYVDMLQIGSRNMQNFSLLKEVGRGKKPVLLKRGLAATLEEWLMAAEYIAAEGNKAIFLCERGIRTFTDHSRNTLDLSVVPILREQGKYPIIVDPSHGTGKRSLVGPMAKAAVAAGAQGIMLEIHPNPSEALSDGPQSLTLDAFHGLCQELKALHQFIQK